MLTVVFVLVGIAVVSTLKWQTPTGSRTEKSAGITKRWVEQPNYEKYTELVYDGNRYFGSPGTCDEAIGKYLGTFTVIGYDYGEKTVESDDDLPEKTDMEEFPAGMWIGGEYPEAQAEVLRETKVEVYEIEDVDISFAIAVKFPDENRYCVYGNNLFEARTYKEFADGTQLLKYTYPGKITLYTASGTKLVAGKCDTIRELLSLLFEPDVIPAFVPWQLPTEFVGDAYLSGDSIRVDSNQGTAPSVGTTMSIVPTEIAEFLQDKELGKLCVEIGVDYRLLGQENVGIKVYSGGFVTTNIGWTGRTFYVGEECVTSFIQVLSDN